MTGKQYRTCLINQLKREQSVLLTGLNMFIISIFIWFTWVFKYRRKLKKVKYDFVYTLEDYKNILKHESI